MTQETVKNIPLLEAVREARQDEALRQDALLAGREIEFERLSLLADYLAPVFKDIPPSIDMFDVGVVAGARPRYFIDMVSFVEMDDTRQIYCFYQDNRAGRQLLGQSKKSEEIAQVILNYVAHRLVAREQLLAFQPQAYIQPVRVQESEQAPALAPELRIETPRLETPRLENPLHNVQETALNIEVTPQTQEQVPHIALAQTAMLQDEAKVDLPKVDLPKVDLRKVHLPKVHLAKQDLRTQVLESMQKINAKPTREHLYTALYALLGATLAVSAYILLSRLISMALN